MLRWHVPHIGQRVATKKEAEDSKICEPVLTWWSECLRNPENEDTFLPMPGDIAQTIVKTAKRKNNIAQTIVKMAKRRKIM